MGNARFSIGIAMAKSFGHSNLDKLLNAISGAVIRIGLYDLISAIQNNRNRLDS